MKNKLVKSINRLIAFDEQALENFKGDRNLCRNIQDNLVELREYVDSIKRNELDQSQLHELQMLVEEELEIYKLIQK